MAGQLVSNWSLLSDPGLIFHYLIITALSVSLERLSARHDIPSCTHLHFCISAGCKCLIPSSFLFTDLSDSVSRSSSHTKHMMHSCAGWKSDLKISSLGLVPLTPTTSAYAFSCHLCRAIPAGAVGLQLCAGGKNGTMSPSSSSECHQPG